MINISQNQELTYNQNEKKLLCTNFSCINKFWLYLIKIWLNKKTKKPKMRSKKWHIFQLTFNTLGWFVSSVIWSLERGGENFKQRSGSALMEFQTGVRVSTNGVSNRGQCQDKWSFKQGSGSAQMKFQTRVRVSPNGVSYRGQGQT